MVLQVGSAEENQSGDERWSRDLKPIQTGGDPSASFQSSFALSLGMEWSPSGGSFAFLSHRAHRTMSSILSET